MQVFSLNFIPFNEQNFDDDGNPMPQSDRFDDRGVKEDVDYAVVLSTCAGACAISSGTSYDLLTAAAGEIANHGPDQAIPVALR
jgi:hypothetical protein